MNKEENAAHFQRECPARTEDKRIRRNPLVNHPEQGDPVPLYPVRILEDACEAVDFRLSSDFVRAGLNYHFKRGARLYSKANFT